MMETIDESQTINTRKESLVPRVQLDRPEMDGEIDADGRVTKAWIVNNTIAWELVKTGFVEECDYYTALVFMDLRRAYESMQGVKWRNMDSGMFDSLGLSAGQAQDYYDNLKHELGLPKGLWIIKIVIHAMNTDLEHNLHESESNQYRIAFERLIKAMQVVNKARKEKLANV